MTPRPRRLAHRLVVEDRGAALAMVLLIGFALILLTSVVAMRSTMQAQTVHVDAVWEQALGIAEAGLDVGLDRVGVDEDFTTGETAPLPFATAGAERDWIVSVADLRSAGDVGVVPDGEYVIVRPTNTEAVYSVGYAPAREADSRRVRVVRAEIGLASEIAGFEATYAVLAGGNLEFSGNPTIASGSAVGVHSNGFLSIGGSSFVEGCISSSGGVSIKGSYSQELGCAVPGNQAPVTVPIVDVRSLWSFSQYDLCPDGRVRAGPAHPEMGITVGNAPCTGAALETDAGTNPYRSWRFLGCCDDKLGGRWEYANDVPYDGVYYFHEGSVSISSNPGILGAPWQVTLLVDGAGSCPDVVGGDLSISGGPVMAPYPNTRNLLMAVERDLDLSGHPTISGVVAIHEQLKMTGNLSGEEAAFLIEGACDSVDDYVDDNVWTGNATVENSGPVATPFRASEDVPVVVAWNEL